MDSMMVEYATKFRELLQNKAELDAVRKELDEKIKDLQTKLVELMESHKVKNLSVENIGTVYLVSNLYPRITDPEVLFTDLRSKGYGSLIKETIHPGTLRAHIKEQMETTNELPAGVEVFAETAVRIRK